MTYVITGSCIKDDSCIEVCPVDCIHPEAGRARLRDRRAAVHRPRGLHRLRRLRGGLPGRRDLRRLRDPREVRVRARAQRGVLRRAAAPPSAPRRDGRPATASGDRRRRAGRGVRRRVPAARPRGDVEIDLFERLPTPMGSAARRGGARPPGDQASRATRFDRQTLARGCRFLGNVEVGVDVSHSELMRHYTAVVYATGAQTDKSLGIPGEDLPGQLGGHGIRRLVQRPP